jgi:DNA gyrase/topoisomerase IV subunit A
MKKVRLLVIPATEEQLQEVLAAVPERERAAQREGLMRTMQFSYKEVLLSSMRSPLDLQRGMDFEEIERTLTIINKIKEVGDGEVLEMDDVDWEYVEKKLDAMRWRFFDERLVKFRHTIRNATKDLLELETNKDGMVKEEVVA